MVNDPLDLGFQVKYVVDPALVPNSQSARDRWPSYFFTTLVVTVIITAVLYYFSNLIGERLLNETLSQFTLSPLGTAFTSLIVALAFWRIALVLFAILIAAALWARLAQFPVGKVVGITALGLVGGFCLYHLCVFIASIIDPGVLTGGFSTAELSLLNTADPLSRLYLALDAMKDLFRYIYIWTWQAYSVDPSLASYLRLYVVGKSFGVTVPVFQGDMIASVAISGLLSFLLFSRWVEPNECYTEAEYQMGAGASPSQRQTPGIKIVRPVRAHPRRQLVAFVVVLALAILPLITIFVIPAQSTRTAIPSWAAYCGSPVQSSGETLASNADDHGTQTESETLTIDLKDTFATIPNFQAFAQTKSLIKTNGSGDLSLARTYALPSPAAVNIFLPIAYAFPTFYAGYDYQKNLTYDSIMNPYANQHLLFVPAWFTDFWDNLEIIYFWGRGTTYYGYSLNNRESADATDLYPHEIPLSGSLVTVQCLEVNASGDIRETTYLGSPVNSTYCPGLRPGADYMLINPFGGTSSFLGLNLFFAEDVFSQAGAREDVLYTLEQLPGFYRHTEAIEAEVVGSYVRVKSGFNLTRYLTPDLNIVLDDATPPLDCVAINENNPFFGIYVTIGETLTTVLAINLIGLLAAATILALNKGIEPIDEGEFEIIRDLYCGLGGEEAGEPLQLTGID